MITLLSDWKLRDPYIGLFKGELLKRMPSVQIIDITHSLELFNFSQTAFIAKNSYSFFPEKTIHIILSGLSFAPEMKPVLVVHNKHFFIGEDTGVFSMMFGAKNIEAYQYNGEISLSATEKIAAMAELAFQNSYAQQAVPYPALKFQLSILSEPDFDEERKVISGKVVYIDSTCNAVTNIPIWMFEKAGKRDFTATISSNARPFKTKGFSPYYNPKEPGIFLIYNSLGFLEITLYEGNIAALADIKVGNNVEIRFD
jgi:S-adenosylmethionine hydrolase